MKYKFLLFDADNTVLDFDKAQENSLQRAFVANGLSFDQNVLAVYRKNNIYLWEQLELGLVDKPTVLTERFRLTFDELNVKLTDEVFHAVSSMYEEGLHYGFQVVAHAEDVLRRLTDEGHKLYLVSNGVLSVQTARMEGSRLGKYFLMRFISEQVGVPKPSKKFFDYAFSQIPDFDKSSALIVGDSLTSDIKGGINAEIATCWFNPEHAANTKGILSDYEIDDLRQLFDIV